MHTEEDLQRRRKRSRDFKKGRIRVLLVVCCIYPGLGVVIFYCFSSVFSNYIIHIVVHEFFLVNCIGREFPGIFPLEAPL